MNQTYVPSLQLLLLGGLILGYLTIHGLHERKKRVKLPVIGWKADWISCPAAIWNVRHARTSVQEGYEKYKNYAFQIPTLSRWEIFICNEAMIREYRNLDSDLMSANAVTAELFQAKYALPGAQEDIHKISIPTLSKGITWQRVRAATKSDPYFSEFYEEFLFAFTEEVPVPETTWVAIPCFRAATRVVSRLTAKGMVGRPLCRDPELIDLFCNYGNAVPTSGFLIAKFPAFLKPLVALMCSAPKMSQRLQNIFLEIAIQRRKSSPKISNMRDLTDWMMNWVDENAASTYNDRDVALQLANIVFGAIHTTSQLLVHSLYEIATRSEYVKALRQEVTECLSKYGGWNKEALEAMWKLDSFVRECQRWNPLDAGSMARRVCKDFTFSNGVRIPAGNWIFAVNSPSLLDPEKYPDAHTFDGFRFSRAREERGQSRNHTLVSSSMINLQFGDGRHGCPGRYMAADEIRLMLAHIVVNYDVAIENHGPRPANMILGKIIFPNLRAKIILRKIRN